MTIPGAIALIQTDIDDESVDWDSPLGKAYKLSFEALKAFQKFQRMGSRINPLRLPGETAE